MAACVFFPNRKGDAGSVGLRPVVENHHTAGPEQTKRDQNVRADIGIGMTTGKVNQAEASGQPITINLAGPPGDDVRQRRVKAQIVLLKLAALEPLMAPRVLR